MGRIYQRKLGARRYADYTLEKLNECLEAIKSGTMSHRKASEHFNIPRRTILNKLKGKHQNKPGKKTIFTMEEEKAFMSYIEVMSNFGFPLTTLDLKHVIRSYLQRTDRNVKEFTDNMPGIEWVKLFLKRHPSLTERFAANIKRSRAAIDEQTLKDYINNLKIVLKDVPADNIWNLDETNVTDDPGQKRVICRRGVKYPEKICNFSKSSTSIMICGSASGEILPPYVVYKSAQLWTTWTEGGPKGARYNHTKSGWFDATTYNDWFETILLPKLKKCPGKTVIIADNLSTHLNVAVLQKCREENIHFVCLPANSTHLTQPLDVAFFRPLKSAWRNLLTSWKKTPIGLKSTVLPKDQLPRLLNEVFEMIKPNIKKNLESGFKKCGIFPCDVEPLLQRIARKEAVDQDAVNSSFLEILQSSRNGTPTSEIGEKQSHKRRRKINVPAGKSVSHAEELAVSLAVGEPGTSGNSEMQVNQSSRNDKNNNSQTHSHASSRKIKKSKSKKNNLESDSSNGVAFEEYWMAQNSSDSGDTEDFIADMEIDTDITENPVALDTTASSEQIFKEVVRRAGEFVVFMYEGELYPGMIESCDDEGALISSMIKSLKSWKWPAKADQLFYLWEDIVGAINPPKILNKRGVFKVPELSKLP